MKLIFKIIAIVAMIAVGLVLGKKILNQDSQKSASSGHGEPDASADYERGSNDGRVLRDGDFAIEVTIYEPDIPPQFRIFPMKNDKPMPLEDVDLVIELHRFGGRVDTIRFSERDDYLVGDMIVEEPHSFDVKVIATQNGKTSSWEYPSYEGRVSMSDASAQSVGLEFAAAGPRKLKTIARMIGKVTPNENTMASVSPRFSGVAVESSYMLGDHVNKGDVLALIESNQSLTNYQIKAPISGTIIQRNITKGTAVSSERPIYVIADLSSVWVELNFPRETFDTLKVGQKITISEKDARVTSEATITRLLPYGSQDTQMLKALALLPNPKGEWRTGLIVHGEMLISEREVPVAVKTSALQTFRDWDVVFMKYGDTYEIAILELGQRDGDWIEIISGLKAGTTYVVENPFVVKADVLKSGASHDH